MSNSLLSRLVPVGVLRPLDVEGTPRVTSMELFFDLVYVFTIIQLSHYLIAHETWRGGLEAAVLFAAVWWAWNYTAWSANWLDPDHQGGRCLMIVLMACALCMAVAMPTAYTDRAALFVGGYVTMALVRAGYMTLAFRGQRMGRNYLQLGIWSALSACFWIAGVVVPEWRLALWLAAVAVDYAGPFATFWVPGLGGTPMETWLLRGHHLLERCQLVFIIALGESILLLGAMLIKHPLTPDVATAAAFGFLLIVALWWLYFGPLTDIGEHSFTEQDDHARLARAGLAYAHGFMVCGAIVVAVMIEQVVAHPLDPTHGFTAIVAGVGPALFLAGSAAFLCTMAKNTPPAYPLAVVVIALWCSAAFLLHLPALALGGGVLAVLLCLCAVCHR